MRVSLAAEYYAFACPARGVLIAIRRPPGSTSLGQLAAPAAAAEPARRRP